MPRFLGGNLPDSERHHNFLENVYDTPLPCVSLKPRGKESVPIVVSASGKHVVKYLVSILNRGVSFSITFCPRDSGTEPTVMRVNSKIKQLTGHRDSLIITRPEHLILPSITLTA